jgi:hypothetical protein
MPQLSGNEPILGLNILHLDRLKKKRNEKRRRVGFDVIK